MITEAKKTVPIVVTIGRFQPLTAGHELVMNKVRDTANKVGGEYRVYTTFSKGDASNPLTHREKVRMMRKQIPGLNVATDPDVRNPFDLMEKLSKEGWKEVYLVVGGSRVPELRKGIGRYVGTKYKFDSFKVVSAGRRDPDADDTSGVSGTKVREMVKKGHKAKFRKVMPSTTSKQVADELYGLLRKRMGLKEEVQLDEVMTVAQKRKRSIIFKRLAPRIRRKKEMMRKRRKTGEQLRKRAFRAAKRAFRKRLLKGKNYYELSFSERVRIDNRIAKIKKTRLQALATRLFPVVVKKERERFAAMNRTEERDYKDEYQKYHSTPQYRADRAARVQARRDAEAEGRVSKGDGKDVDHINGNARDNSKGNTRVVSASTNRGRRNNSKKYTNNEEHGAGEEGTPELVKRYKKETPGQPVTEVYRNSGLGKWFHGQSSGGDPGWDRYNTKGEKVGKCGDSKPGEGKPKCLSRQKAAKLRAQGGKKAIGNAVRRKRQKDPTQDRPGTGNKPINVSNRIDKDPNKKGIQDMKSFDQFKQSLQEKNKPTSPDKWSDCISQAKSKFDVYPSAYANAWAAKCYKKKGGGWQAESVELDEAKFSPAQLNKLKQEYGKLKTVDPGSPTYKKLTKFLDGLSTEQLQQMVDARIPFLRGLAVNRINRRKMNEATMADRKVVRQRKARPLEKKTTNIALVLPDTPEIKQKMKKILGFSDASKNAMAKLVVGREKRGNDLVLYFKSAQGRKKFSKMLNAKSDWVGESSEYGFFGRRDPQGSHIPQPRKGKKFDTSLAGLRKRRAEAEAKRADQAEKKPEEKKESVELDESRWDLMYKKGDLEAHPTGTHPTYGYTTYELRMKGKKISGGHTKTEVKNAMKKHKLNTEDWQSVNRKDKTDGLSQKAVDAYRRENPGSKLQTAVTEKKPTGKRAKRRASFCRRMKGMKAKLTGSKTANDPDSRINKALRRWNC